MRRAGGGGEGAGPGAAGGAGAGGGVGVGLGVGLGVGVRAGVRVCAEVAVEAAAVRSNIVGCWCLLLIVSYVSLVVRFLLLLLLSSFHYYLAASGSINLSVVIVLVESVDCQYQLQYRILLCQIFLPRKLCTSNGGGGRQNNGKTLVIRIQTVCCAGRWCLAIRPNPFKPFNPGP